MPLNVSHINTRYDEIDYSKINDKLFKPLNLYSFYISPEPIRLKEYYQQLLYSECLINILDENRISMVSRCATQAFKQVKSFDDSAPKECFKTLFAFYISWFPDIDEDVIIEGINSEDSPFYFPKSIKHNFKKIYPEPRKVLEPQWIDFYIKKQSKFIKDGYGKLELDMPIYNIILRGSLEQ